MSGFRIFVTSSKETQVVEAPPGVEEAYDIMTADRVPSQRAADMALEASKAGHDPVKWALHFVELRKSMRH